MESTTDPSTQDSSTEVVYVCSPDREEQLLISIGSLLAAGEGVDRVVVFCVGPVPSRWKFTDSRIMVKSVPPLFGKYFMGNKVYVGTRSAPRVVYLDADTIVRRPLYLLWQQRQSADVIGRVGTAYKDKMWNDAVWVKTFESIGSSTVPKFNSGVLVFQHHAQQRIRDEWSNFIKKYLRNELTPPCNDMRRHYEEWALALAIGSMKLNYSVMSSSGQSYAWGGEGYKECVVFHTGNQLYDKFVREIGGLAPIRLKGNNHRMTIAVIKLRRIIAYCARARVTGAIPARLRPGLSAIRRNIISFLDSH